MGDAIMTQDTAWRERSAERKNLFLAAALHTMGEARPVRIRNLSSRGAMIEGDTLPPVNADIRLSRGGLSAAGQIAWIRPGRAGLRLDHTLDVGVWMAPPVNRDQARVDRVVAALRAGEEVSIPPSKPEVGTDRDTVRLIERLIVKLSDRLAEDALMVAAHASDLQQFDLIAQMLGCLLDPTTTPERLRDLQLAAHAALLR